MMRVPLGPVIGRYPSSTNGSDGQIGSDNGGGGGVIRHNRRCRDIGFLVLFVVFWVAMIVNSSFGFNQGNPLRLSHGLDFKGNVCGDKHAKPNLRGFELRYWLNPNQVYLSGVKDSLNNLEDAKSICVKNCPVTSEDSLKWVCNYPEGEIHLSMKEWVHRDYDYFDMLTSEMRNSSLQLLGPCYPLLFPSVNVYWSCQYVARVSNASLQHWHQIGGVAIDENMLIDKTIHKSINSRSAVLKRYIADIGRAWGVLIVCGGIIPLFLSVIWLLLIRYFTAAMTWITVGTFNILIISVTIFYYLKAGWIGNDAVSPIIGKHDPYYHLTGREQGDLRFVAVLMTFAVLVSVLSTIAIVRRILMATSVLKVASKVIGEVQALIIFPIVPYLLLAVFYMIWFSATLHLFSSGDVEQNACSSNCCTYDLGSNRVSCDHCCGYRIKYTPHLGLAIAFHLLGCYWATQFLKAFSSTVIAGSVASYYWAHGEALQGVLFLPVFSSMKRLLRYNFGSVAIGSLVVSIIGSTQPILKSLRQRLKVADVRPENWFGKVVYYTAQYILASIGWTIRHVNRNAYILIAITGETFFNASAIATDLIRNNILRIGKVNVIGDVILFLGKLSVSLASALFAFLMLDTHRYRSSHNKVSSPLSPVLVCSALGYVVATLFFAVVEVSIDTIILSYCQDSEEHQGNARYAPPLLLETLDDQSEMQRLTQ